MAAAADQGALCFDSLPAARFEFGGPVRERVRVNVDNWLLRAPQANPGMLEMFRVRDRKPTPELVPWAGEFVGKYLISAVQALRMVEDPRLRQQVTQVVAEFIATQAEDGYLGPFPQAKRLRGNWDLWGHYHALLALMLWHEHTGDPAALAAARRAADLVCNIYLDTGHRVLEAGDPEMNMAILTGLVRLHRVTGEPRYLRMAHEVEKDWEQAGDYLRAGLDGREFFRSPRPRWESLHDLQGLLELWQVTGESRYREAFIHHWRSIRRWDRRNTGGFSSGEQATGNPYAPTAIETCCTVAWMALTIDYLRLTGDPQAADDLELSTLNGGLGAQHPSGRWWTYNTPMDGVREASAHTIVFQSRAGTPELNCCSVNAPRVLGALSEWAVMAGTNGLVINWLGTMRCVAPLPDGTRVEIRGDGEAWRFGQFKLQLQTTSARELPLQVRIPAWAHAPVVRLNGEVAAGARAGTYFAIRRRWAPEDRLEVSFSLPVRAVPGAHEAAGKVSLYRGPVLLAYDQACNSFDEDGIPAIDLSRLEQAEVLAPARSSALGVEPWLLVNLPAKDGKTLRLVDFANAGASGTRYRSWLAAETPPPPPAFTMNPADGIGVPAGPVTFRWRSSRRQRSDFQVEVSSTATFSPGTVWTTNVQANRVVLNTQLLLSRFVTSGAPLWWRVVTGSGETAIIPDVPPAWFRIDATLPARPLPADPKLGPDSELVQHSLRENASPEWGTISSCQFTDRNAEGTLLNGRDQMLVYHLAGWPEEDFTVSVRAQLQALPDHRIGQVFSAWNSAMDDPLRLVIDNGKLFAKIEAGNVYSTPGSPVETNRWYAVCAVKRGSRLTLYVDGEEVGSAAVPEWSNSQAQHCALGGNPRYTGPEFLAARFADFRLLARALSPEEVKAWASAR